MSKAAKKQINGERSKATVSEKVRDYSNDPYVVKKAKESKAFLDQHGFPKELLDKR